MKRTHATPRIGARHVGLKATVCAALCIGAGLLLPASVLAQTPTAAAASAPTLTLPDGRRYTGELRDGRPHGRGVLVWPEDGPWRNEKRYEGEFFEGAMHGRGVMDYRNGNRYEGDFALNRHWGRGTLVFLGGSRYEGDFVAGEMSGQGLFSFYFNLMPTGERLEGEFIKGQLNGVGRELQSRGVTQEGGYLDGKRAGPWMRVHNRDRTQYDKGDYVNGKREGPGEVRSGKGPATPGFWKQDGFTPLSLWPRGLPLPERSAEALQLEAEVQRRSALAQQHHRDAQAMHLATAAARQQMARAVLGQPAVTVAAAPVRPAALPGAAATPASAANLAAAPAATPSPTPLSAPSSAPLPLPSPTVATAPPAPAMAAATLPPGGVTVQLQGLIDQLDRMDRLDLQTELDRSRRCTEAQDLDCAEASLRKARRYANGSGDKALVQRQLQVVAAAREEVAERRRRLEQEERDLAEREQRLQRQARQERETERASTPAVNPWIAGMAAGLSASLSDYEKVNRIHNDTMNKVQSALAERDRRAQEQRQAQNDAQAERARERIAEQRAEIARQRQALEARPVVAAAPPPTLAPVPAAAPAAPLLRIPPATPAAAPERATPAATAPAEREPDIREPEWDFGGRRWLPGGGESRRKLVPTRALACEQAERDREETIALNARDSRDRGVERRSDCVCSYSGWTKSWVCRNYFLPVGHTASQPNDR